MGRFFYFLWEVNYYTEISFPKPPRKIEYHHKLCFLGSCFSENIGQWFGELRYQSTVNPIGITYNPISIGRQLESAGAPNENHIVSRDERWFSLDAHSTVFAETKTALEKTLEEKQVESSKTLKEADFIFLTFGTSIGFKYKKTGEIINNCQRMPGSEFEQVKISADEAYEAVKSGIERMLSTNPNAVIYTTVSPIRHLRHGAVENMRSKARLIEVCDRLETAFPAVQYLPIFEFVMDELRDYRFYSDKDLIHLNVLGLRSVQSKIREHLIHPSSYELMDRIEKWNKMKNHKIVNPESERTRKFLEKMESENASINEVLTSQFDECDECD